MRKGGIGQPILILHSARSNDGADTIWHEEYRRSDLVLDVEDMKREGKALGQQVTIRAIEGGVHDLVLSDPDAQARVFAEVTAWLRGLPGNPVGREIAQVLLIERGGVGPRSKASERRTWVEMDTTVVRLHQRHSGAPTSDPAQQDRGLASRRIAACSIRVSTRAFVRIERIERKAVSVKFFVFNNQQWFESHPLRHSKSPKQNRLDDPDS